MSWIHPKNDDVDVETAIPATKPISYKENTRGNKKKNKRATLNTSQSDAALIRRLVFISTAVVVVAFLTAAATLILVLGPGALEYLPNFQFVKRERTDTQQNIC